MSENLIYGYSKILSSYASTMTCYITAKNVFPGPWSSLFERFAVATLFFCIFPSKKLYYDDSIHFFPFPAYFGFYATPFQFFE